MNYTKMLRKAATGVIEDPDRHPGVFCALGQAEGAACLDRPDEVERLLFDIFDGGGDLWKVPAEVRALGLCLAASMAESPPTSSLTPGVLQSRLEAGAAANPPEFPRAASDFTGTPEVNGKVTDSNG